LDLSEIEGSGSGGMITIKDVESMAEGAQEGASEAAGQADGAADTANEDGSGEPKATNAAKRKAEELGVDLSQITGSGAGGLITIKDVVGS
jgi:pyruvate/2-oxoglutarate dehydrogenase complex dihydrolipoamide acyltransferase (E2) component